jgi:NAD(P)-dependent dehydrogenase (short-subunit alcohol dehydrogenase family)
MSLTILIAGASRGLGHGLAAEFAERGWHVIGTVRGDRRTPLHDLADEHPGGIEIETLDIADDAQIAALRDRLAGRRLDALFVNAGVTTREPQAPLDRVAAEDFLQVMQVNALAPLRVIEALAPLVPADGLIGAMSSGQGSIANATNGRNDAYRASKAALNMLLKGFAAREGDKPRAIVALAPGWIQTDLGGEGATYTLEESLPKLADVLIAKRGRPGFDYLDRDGRVVPW